MTTFTAITTLTSEASAYALSEAMENMQPEPTGVGVFEMEDGSGLWEVGGYFIEAPNDVELTLLAQAFGAKPFVVSELPEIDWVAKVKRDLSPVEAGRFFVYGSHDAEKLPEGRIGLLIEAAMAFGTGHHGTTLGCLRALDRLDNAGFRGKRVADIGCGTAVLAMGAAKIWPEPVLASDIDAIAVEVAQANVTANGLDGRVQCLEATGFDHPRPDRGVAIRSGFRQYPDGAIDRACTGYGAHDRHGGLCDPVGPFGRTGRECSGRLYCRGIRLAPPRGYR